MTGILKGRVYKGGGLCLKHLKFVLCKTYGSGDNVELQRTGGLDLRKLVRKFESQEVFSRYGFRQWLLVVLSQIQRFSFSPGINALIEKTLTII